MEGWNIENPCSHMV